MKTPISSLKKVRHLNKKSATKSATPKNDVGLNRNSIIKNDLSGSNLLVSLKESATLTGNSERTFQRRCVRGEIDGAVQVKGLGGLQWRIPLSALPFEAQERYLEAEGIVKKPTAMDLVNRDQAFMRRGAISLLNREKALNRYRVLSAYVSFLDGQGYGGIVGRKAEFCRRYNEGLMLEFDDLRGEIKHLTFQTLDSWRKMVDDADGDSFALAPGYGKSRGKRSVTTFEGELLRRAYLIPGKPKIQAIIDMKNELKRKGFVPNSSDATYMRYLGDFVQDNYSLVTMTREGEKAFNDKCSPYICRDYRLVEVGDVLVADGHTLNFDVINPYTGRPFRPTIVVVSDFRSGMPLGWEIGASENTQIIAMAYYRAIVTLGFVPKHFYLDNGRAFKSKYFTKVKDWETLPGLFERLKPFGYIKTVHAIAYHGQSKPIERFFGVLHDFEQRRAGYRGYSIESKVPRLMRNEKLQQLVHKNMHKGAVDTINDVNFGLADWLLNKYAVTPKAKDSSLQGRTPKEVYMESIEVVRSADGFDDRVITPEALRFLMLAQTKKKSTRNGIKMFGRHYWHEELFAYAMDKEFVVRFDFAELERVFVYDESGENFLFDATANGFAGMHPMADTLGTDEDSERLRGALETIGGLKKATVHQAKDFYAAMQAEESAALPMVVPQKQLVEAKKAVGCETTAADDDLDRMLEAAEELRMQEAEERRRIAAEEDERLDRLMYD